MITECSICNTDFNTEEEGGVQGDIGMLPVSFCPFCLSGVLDMSKQLLGIEEEWVTNLKWLTYVLVLCLFLYT